MTQSTEQELINKLDKRIELLEQNIELRFNRLEAKINWLLGLVFAVGSGILATLYSQPILNALS